MNETKLVEAVATIQKFLAQYKDIATPDGPWIQIRPESVEIVSCDGIIMGSGNALEEVLDCINNL